MKYKVRDGRVQKIRRAQRKKNNETTGKKRWFSDIFSFLTHFAATASVSAWREMEVSLSNLVLKEPISNE